MRKLVATLCATSLLGLGVVGTAGAQQQNGLVNVAVDDVNILNNARIGVAAQVAAALCGIKVGPVAVLGTAVDASGDAAFVCEAANGPVTITNS